MQISTSQFFANNQRHMRALTADADRLQAQIATGKKLLAPSDDAVSYRRLQGLTRDAGDDAAYGVNITIVASGLSQADTALTSIGDAIQRAKELAVKANSGTLSASDRSVIASELDSIVKTITDLANAKDSRGAALFAIGATAAVTDNGDGTFTFATRPPDAIPIDGNSAAAPGEAASRLFVDANGGNILAGIASLASALRGGGDITATATSVGNAIDASVGRIGGVQGALGARAQRVDIESIRLKDVATDREATRSAIEDTDVTQAITDLQKTMTILSAAQASFTRLSSLSLFNYLK